MSRALLHLSAPDLPAPIAAALAGAHAEDREWATSEQATVHRYRRPDASDLFLKVQRHGDDAAKPGLQPERDIMTWLDGRLGAPRLVAYHEDGSIQYLVSEAVAGRSGLELRAEADKEALTRQLAAGLRQIHALPTAGCPGDGRQATLIAAAEARLRSGRLPAAARDELAQNLHQLRRLDAPVETLVFTHGDYCLPNVLLDGGAAGGSGVGGCVDWGYAGIGDAYRDFVAADFSVGHNLGTEWVPLFFEAYGARPDPERMAFYKLLYDLW